MTFIPAWPISGSAVTGLTSPTYTGPLDINNGLKKSWVITGLGGTQTGVQAHSNSNPFSIMVQKANSPKTAPVLQANGTLKGGGKNVTKISLLKGLVPLAGQAPVPSLIDTRFEIVAGADGADKNSILAMVSFYGAFLAGNAQAIADMLVSNQL